MLIIIFYGILCLVIIVSYDIIIPSDNKFISICDECEKEIVTPNLSKNGGTLNFSNLVYNSDILIVCYKEKEIVGFNSLVMNKNELYIYQIGVKPGYKNQKIGTNLMKLAIDIAKKKNLMITAHVREYNIYSKMMMESVGLKKIDEYSSTNNLFYLLDVRKKKNIKK